MTTAQDGLLDRARSLKEAQELIGLARPALVEAADYGAKLFGRLLDVHRPDEVQDQKLALVFPYLILIEMLDGVEILLSSAAPIPARLQLRTAFEALLTIEYILEMETRRRALAWVVCNIHRQIDIAEGLDFTTPLGLKYKKDYESDDLVGSNPLTSIDSTKLTANLRKALALPHLQESEAEFQNLARLRRRMPPRWYSFHGGPKGLKGLAQCVKKAGLYGILYREWSGTAHVDDLHRQLGGSGVRILREVGEFATSASFALAFFIRATRKLTQYYLPSDVPAFESWYRAKTRIAYNRLSGVRLDKDE